MKAMIDITQSRCLAGLLGLAAVVFWVSTSGCGPAAQTPGSQTVQAGCGSCVFKMNGVEGCQLAVKIDGQAYLVSGANIDAHKAGLCEQEKTATVTGQVKDGKFVATSFALQK